jgi:hypothetical protein
MDNKPLRAQYAVMSNPGRLGIRPFLAKAGNIRIDQTRIPLCDIVIFELQARPFKPARAGAYAGFVVGTRLSFAGSNARANYFSRGRNVRYIWVIRAQSRGFDPSKYVPSTSDSGRKGLVPARVKLGDDACFRAGVIN